MSSGCEETSFVNNTIQNDTYIEKELFIKFLLEKPIPNEIKASYASHLPFIYLILNDLKLINDYLSKKKFKWSIYLKDQNGFTNDNYNFERYNDITSYIFPMNLLPLKSIEEFIFKEYNGDSEISHDSLSSGEKLLLTIYLWEFSYEQSNQKNNTEKSAVISANQNKLMKDQFVLLLDEPDAHLHTNKLKYIFDFIENTLVREMKMQVILTTHNPATLTLVENKNLFVMFECKINGKSVKKIVKASESPLHPSEMLSTGLIINNQHLVLVESDLHKCFFKELNRQLNVLAVNQNDCRLKLAQNIAEFEFSNDLRFVTLRTQNYTYTNKINKEVNNRLKKEIENWKSNLDKLENEKYDEIKEKINEIKEILTFESKYEDIDRILKGLKEFIPLKKKDIDNVIESLKEDKIHDKKVTSEIIKNLVSKSNAYFKVETKLRNFTFGILDNQISDNLCNEFVAYTDRDFLELYIFDPLNVFFVLQKKKPDCELCKKINLNNWNENFLTDDTDLIEKNLNLILEKIQEKLFSFDVDCNEIIEQQNENKEFKQVKCIQPMVNLNYRNEFFNQSKAKLFSRVRRLFCNCEICLETYTHPVETECEFAKIFCNYDNLSSNYDKNIFHEMCTCKMLEYLKENSFNFIIPMPFVKRFQFLRFFTIYKYTYETKEIKEEKLKSCDCESDEENKVDEDNKPDNNNESHTDKTSDYETDQHSKSLFWKIHLALQQDPGRSEELFKFNSSITELVIQIFKEDELTPKGDSFKLNLKEKCLVLRNQSMIDDYLHFYGKTHFSTINFLFVPNVEYKTLIHFMFIKEQYDLLKNLMDFLKSYDLFKLNKDLKLDENLLEVNKDSIKLDEHLLLAEFLYFNSTWKLKEINLKDYRLEKIKIKTEGIECLKFFKEIFKNIINKFIIDYIPFIPE